MRTVLIGGAALAAAVLTGCAATASPATPARTPQPVRTSAAPAPSTSPPTRAEIAHRAPPPNHCAGNRAPQRVIVQLSVQHMWLCHRSRTVHSNPITSGMAGPYTTTPTGHYRIQGLNRNTVLTLNTGATYDVKYWIPFDAPLFGFHDSSWQHFPYGSPKYRTHGSHGCIHMPLKAIAFLYRWADIGTAVTIS